MSDPSLLNYGGDGWLRSLADLEATIASRLDVARASRAELQRQAKARPCRRGRSGPLDSRKYAIGGAIMLLTGPIDAVTMLGLFAQVDTMLKWMAKERLARGPLPFGKLVAAILDDPRRADWCRRWGAILEWSNRKAAYDATVTSFIQSGRTGQAETWRRDPVTDEQADLIATLCTVLATSAPPLTTKGEAFEWIKDHGGNPEYWVPPPHPNTWSDDDDDAR